MTKVNNPAEVTPPIVELWTPFTYGSDFGNKGHYPAAKLVTNGAAGYCTFQVPSGFTALDEATIVVIPQFAVGAANWDTFVNFAAVGETYNTHSADETAATYDTTSKPIFGISITALLSGIVAGDFVGVKLLCPAGAADGCYALGVRFKYA